MAKLEKHFVTFLSPGTFFAEQTSKPIISWDVDLATQMAHDIEERYEATPYGFYFSTQARGDDDLNSHRTAHSHTYYLGGTIETLADIEARATKDDEILLSNMRCNNYDRVITNTNSWRTTMPFVEGDVLLDWTPAKKQVTN